MEFVFMEKFVITTNKHNTVKGYHQNKRIPTLRISQIYRIYWRQYGNCLFIIEISGNSRKLKIARKILDISWMFLENSKSFIDISRNF